MLAVVALMMFFDGDDRLMSGLAIPSLKQIGLAGFYDHVRIPVSSATYCSDRFGCSRIHR
jgi:hypothetical protein